ncbi:hypothetical protein GCM10009678_26510 [Actinomadura kijaniata]|uniref:Uncharacterized protein n=1 Tax=Actinomadura namibiensis TaxID=182080 RepID=A0A7W3LUS5_ACTNM|nr:hypothetical protein [Actinomadura namibiensis]MBA8954639.1 hypothetical protein [Actinomadura namibiensis]
MGQQGDRIFAAIERRGYPDPWSTFGEQLSWESAYAVQLKTAIDIARKGTDPQAAEHIGGLFAAKARNLAAARKLVDQALTEYDRTGMWEVLDDRAAQLDIEDVSERWAAGLVHHPFPIALWSLQFNWRYMKDHGVRAFYEMTTGYIEALISSHDRWAAAWEAEAATGAVDRVTTVECDLVSEEAPMHCDICQKTITALLYLDDAPAA